MQNKYWQGKIPVCRPIAAHAVLDEFTAVVVGEASCAFAKGKEKHAESSGRKHRRTGFMVGTEAKVNEFFSK